MGLFKKLKKVVKKIPAKVVKTVTSPKKLSTAIATGGISVVAPKITKPIEKAIGSTLYNPQLALAVVTRGQAGSIGGAKPMGINLGGLLGGVGQALSGVTGANASGIRALGTISSIAAAAVPVKATGNPLGVATTKTGVTPAMSLAGPAIRSVATVGRSFFNRFPNLALALQTYRNAGKKVTRGKLFGLVRRFGPEIVISGGLLTAAAVNELMIAGPGTRRMNPANTKALRRSMRRVESFHKLCQRTDMLRTRGRRKVCK